MRGASIDIGSKNFAILVEDFDFSDSSKEKIVKNSRYTQNGEPTPKMKGILEKIFMNGNIVFLLKKDFWCDKGKFITCKSLKVLAVFLKTLQNLFLSCDFVLIEKQVQKNNNARRIEAHVESFLLNLFLDHNRNTPVIIYPSSNKTRVLGAPKIIVVNGRKRKMTKVQRKKWSSDVMKNILLKRGDVSTFTNLFVENKKPDDISDCETMLQSFKFKLLVDGYELEIDKTERKNLRTIIQKYEGQCFSNMETSPNVLCQFKCFFGHEFWLSKQELEEGKWCRKCLFTRREEICKFYNSEYPFLHLFNLDFYRKYYGFMYVDLPNEDHLPNVSDDKTYDIILLKYKQQGLSTALKDFRLFGRFLYKDNTIEGIKKKVEEYQGECMSVVPTKKLLIKCSHSVVNEKTLKDIEKCCGKKKIFKCGCE
jgi:hypothetical protein